MNHRQLELVRSSYERIRRVRPLFADLFNRRLMLIAPVLDRMLPSDPQRRDDAVIELIEYVVAGLDRLDVLLPVLAAQARAWRQRGVEPADYDVAGMALTWTVEQVLASSPGAIAAWSETFDLLAGVMKRAVTEPDVAPPPPRRAFVMGETSKPPARPALPPPRPQRTPPRSERTPPRSYRLPQVGSAVRPAASAPTYPAPAPWPPAPKPPARPAPAPRSAASERPPPRSHRGSPASERTPTGRDTWPSF